jgi:Fic family protein
MKLGEYRGKQTLFERQKPEVLETLRTVAIIESSESSNRLEGITVPKDRLKKLMLQSTTPRDRSEQEIAGYRDALQLIHESWEGMPVSSDVILQIHRTIFRYQSAPGGHWKMTDNEIVERASDGSILRVRFKPVSAVATPQAMEDLVLASREAEITLQQAPLVVVPLFVLDFLCIHPFSDGNGRVARLLTLQLLYRIGYEVGRYISLERLFEESKETYYETLETSSQQWHEGIHDVNPWMNYFWGVLLRAYREFEERVGDIGGGKGAKGQQVRAAVGRRIMPFQISELERDCPGISREMIRVVLGQLRDEGKLILEGRGRGARWRKVKGHQ